MLNIAALMGRLTADPELRTTQSGLSVISFRIAVDRNTADSSGSRQTDFIDIVAWRGTAEFVCKYFTKGQMIAVNGSIQTRSYEDKQGNKRTVVEVVAANVNFCGSKNEDSTHSAPRKEAGVGYWNYGSSYAPPMRERKEAPATENGFTQQSLEEEPEGYDSDDDLPF